MPRRPGDSVEVLIERGAHVNDSGQIVVDRVRIIVGQNHELSAGGARDLARLLKMAATEVDENGDGEPLVIGSQAEDDGVLLTPAQVAERLDIPEAALEIIYGQGCGPQPFKVDPTPVYQQSVVDDWQERVGVVHALEAAQARIADAARGVDGHSPS